MSVGEAEVAKLADRIAATIRQADGSHSMGAGALGEAIAAGVVDSGWSPGVNFNSQAELRTGGSSSRDALALAIYEAEGRESGFQHTITFWKNAVVHIPAEVLGPVSVPVVDREALATYLMSRGFTEALSRSIAVMLPESGLFRDAADVWDEAYPQGVDDARAAEGIATPNRPNPYRSAS